VLLVSIATWFGLLAYQILDRLETRHITARIVVAPASPREVRHLGRSMAITFVLVLTVTPVVGIATSWVGAGLMAGDLWAVPVLLAMSLGLFVCGLIGVSYLQRTALDDHTDLSTVWEDLREERISRGHRRSVEEWRLVIGRVDGRRGSIARSSERSDAPMGHRHASQKTPMPWWAWLHVIQPVALVVSACALFVSSGGPGLDLGAMSLFVVRELLVVAPLLIGSVVVLKRQWGAGQDLRRARAGQNWGLYQACVAELDALHQAREAEASPSMPSLVTLIDRLEVIVRSMDVGAVSSRLTTPFVAGPVSKTTSLRARLRMALRVLQGRPF